MCLTNALVVWKFEISIDRLMSVLLAPDAKLTQAFLYSGN